MTDGPVTRPLAWWWPLAALLAAAATASSVVGLAAWAPYVLLRFVP